MAEELQDSAVDTVEHTDDYDWVVGGAGCFLRILQNKKNGQLEIWGKDGRHPEIEKAFERRKGIPVQCRSCEYEWEYNGAGHNATCPNCQRNNNLHEHPLWNEK